MKDILSILFIFIMCLFMMLISVIKQDILALAGWAIASVMAFGFFELERNSK